MRQLAAISSFTILGLAVLDGPTQGRDLVLNYQDPHGTALVLAVVLNAGELPNSLVAATARGAGDRVSEFALSPAENSGPGEKLSRYVFEPTTQAKDKMDRVGPMEVGPANRPRVEIQPTGSSLRSVPECGTDTIGYPCRVSGVANEVLASALQTSVDNSTGFAALLASNNLVLDDRAAKRVIVTLDDQNVIEHTDFVGLVRGHDESLPAPDAVSAFVVRMKVDGDLSIVERRAETLDPSAIKFGYENHP